MYVESLLYSAIVTLMLYIIVTPVYICVMQNFYPRDAMLARVFAIATCPSVCPSVRLSHAGIVTSRAKAGS